MYLRLVHILTNRYMLNEYNSQCASNVKRLNRLAESIQYAKEKGFILVGNNLVLRTIEGSNIKHYENVVFV